MSEAVVVQPIPARGLVVLGAVALLFLLLAYVVAFDQGAISRSGDLIHELLHDGRHLLGVPCH